VTDLWVSTLSNIAGYTGNLEEHGASARVMELCPATASTQT